MARLNRSNQRTIFDLRGNRIMSTPNPQPGRVPAAPADAVPPPRQREIVVISHSGLFYWWPVWTVGFIMFLITAMTGEYMVTAPPQTVAKEGAKIEGIAEPRDAYILPAKAELPKDPDNKVLPQQPTRLWMSNNKNLG